MRKQRQERGVLDTSVVIELDTIDIELLPLEVAVTAITMAELAARPHATADLTERARRQDAGRKARGARAIDLLIAAIACSEELPLFTRNPDDFAALDGLVVVHSL